VISVDKSNVSSAVAVVALIYTFSLRNVVPDILVIGTSSVETSVVVTAVIFNRLHMDFCVLIYDKEHIA